MSPAGANGPDPAELARRWELVLPHRERALRVARARAASSADAEDLAQEALLRAVTVENLDPATVGGLITTIVKNLATDDLRRRTTGVRYERRLSADDRPVAPVGERICDASEAQWLHERLSALPQGDREVLLHRAAGHSVAGAARVLGLTYKAVESAQTRARRALLIAWRSTLAAVLGLVAAARRSVARGGLLPVLPALAVAPAVWALLLIEPGLSDAQAGPDAPDALPRTTSAVVVNAVSSLGEGAAATRRPATPEGTDRTVDVPASSTVAYTGSIGDRQLVQAGAGADREHPNETLPQTLDRCLRDGVDVRLTSIDCRDSAP